MKYRHHLWSGLQKAVKPYILRNYIAKKDVKYDQMK